MIKRKWLLASILALTLGVVGSAIYFFNQTNKSSAVNPGFYTADINEIYTRLKRNLDSNYPGYGVSDYGNHDVAHIPKAYAMLLSAELFQYYKSFGNYDLELAHKAGRWLLDNHDLNQNGITGWGVPIAWDAFGDGSVNASDSEYTISTGIVINALLDWIELAPESAPKNEIIERINAAIEPYLEDSIFSSSGLFNYSLLEQDRKYNVFNAAAYMAGQMQRFQRFVDDDYLKKRIAHATDKVMLAHFNFKQLDVNEGWFWTYSIEESTTPNDLAHAGYVIDGILSYIDNKGNLSSLFDREAVLKHLDIFSNNNHSEWSFLPRTHGHKPIGARLYGLGFTLHLLAKYFPNDDRIPHLIAFLEKYKKGDAYTRWQNEDVVITEYLTYVMYGLASVNAYPVINNTMFLKTSQNHGIEMEKILGKSNNAESSIPLAKFVEGVDTLFSKDTLHTSIVFEGHKVALDKLQAVPLKIIENNSRYIILMRELLTNHLYVVTLDKLNQHVQYQNIDTYKDSFLDFREAIFQQEKLLVVVYDSLKGKNFLKVFIEDGVFKEKNSIELPSVQDPAGSTYEVIPKFFMLSDLQSESKVHIMAGRLYVIYDGSSLIKQSVPSSIESFTEVIRNNQGEFYALAKTTSTTFAIYDFQTQSHSHMFKQGEVPFNLAFYYKRPQYRLLATKNDIKELFVKDFLTNKGNGILYLGSNNLEGWSAWAQVYYLNGLLSFLELANNDLDFFDIFKDYIVLAQQRLELEMFLLTHQLHSEDGLRVRVFSIDRSLSTFAVQSSRFALLYQRYLKLFPHDKYAQQALELLDSEVVNLTNHMEVLEKGTGKTVSKKWNPNNEYYLAWPRGNAFYFDGLPVPYNHQNEWATYVIQTEKQEVAQSIINLFVNNITNHRAKNQLPKKAIWPYWWAKAWDGWGSKEDVSVNRPSYSGDTGDGWISFRTIDTIAMLKLFATKKEFQYVDQIVGFVNDGDLYPFVAKELYAFNRLPRLADATISKYIRFTSPWEFDNVIWSYLSFIQKMNNS